MGIKWLKRVNDEGTYYAFGAAKSPQYSLVGPEKEFPTPGDIFAAVAERGEEILSDTQSCVGVKYIEDTSSLEQTALPAGAYIYRESGWRTPERLVETKVRSDSSIKRTAKKLISKDLKGFIKSQEIYNRVGIQFRRGVLMYGPPGEGKTTIIRQLAREFTKQDAITVFMSSIPSAPMLKNLNQIEADRLKVVIIEELVSVLENSHDGIDQILDFLDGETSLQKAIIIATTNYPHRLPANIAERHSRFDLLVEIGSPDPVERKALVKHYFGSWPSYMNTDILEGLSTATIKEICIYALVNKISLRVATDKVRQRITETKEKFESYNDSEDDEE